MTLTEAKQLKSGDILNPNIEYAGAEIVICPNPACNYARSVKVFPKGIYNSDGTLLRYKVTSVKTWKRSPEKVLIKAKRGLYEYVTLNENTIHLLVKA